MALKFAAAADTMGIDLGTSKCCAAVNRRNGIEAVALDYKGERLLPSFVSFDEKKPICGNLVIDRLRNFSNFTVFDSKRIIGRKMGDIVLEEIWPFGIIEKDGKIFMSVKKVNGKGCVSAEEVAAILLKKVKEESEKFQGKKLADVVITVPAAFTKAQKDATIEAAKLAGFKEVKLLPEPIAAAFAYFINRPIPNNSTVLLFDLGGGTLDVCIFKIINDQICIISNTGDSKLGGRDFDTILINHFKNQLSTKYNITLLSKRNYQMMTTCQKIKETLSVMDKSL
uniref:Heat shock protein 70 n=1 Tax=Panagrolaimus superbus TaxID=310955 RepID=A0A914YFQ5_9BILA